MPRASLLRRLQFPVSEALTAPIARQRPVGWDAVSGGERTWGSRKWFASRAAAPRAQLLTSFGSSLAASVFDASITDEKWRCWIGSAHATSSVTSG